MFKPRKNFLLPLAVFTGLIGLTTLLGVTNNPRFETIHRLDVIRLMTAGAGFGIAFVTLMMYFNPRPFSDDKREGEKSGEGPK